jgi:plasmid stabilization system protein ParE
MRRLIWSAEATASLRAIQLYLAQFNPFAAQRLAVRLNSAAESLCEFPGLGRPVGNEVRELTTARPYVIRYLVQDDAIYVVVIRHGAREPL